MSTFTMLTGATGLLGQYLLREMVHSGRRVAVLVRPAGNVSAFERVEAVMQRMENRFGSPLPRPVVFEGSITEEGFGLSESHLKWISENCREIVHNAAVLTFHGARNAEPWATNLDGTRNVIDFCHQNDIRRMHYVSTAYVCGLREGTIMEDELDSGQSFRNDYERSKFEAELLIRSDGRFDNVTVYRPTVIAGDSETGYTCTYHGLYMYLRLMDVICSNVRPDSDGIRFTPANINMSGDERRNIIPVDWASNVICRLMDIEDAQGLTHHIGPHQPITTGTVLEAGSSYFNSRGAKFHDSESPLAKDDEDFSKTAFENMGMYRLYDATDPSFDITNLQRFLPELPCPVIDEKMLHRFLRFGQKDRWGKRRPPQLLPFSVDSLLPADSNGRLLS